MPPYYIQYAYIGSFKYKVICLKYFLTKKWPTILNYALFYHS